MFLEKAMKDVKDALSKVADKRVCFDDPVKMSDGTKVASVELRGGKVDALTKDGYATLDDLELQSWDWQEILSAINHRD